MPTKRLLSHIAIAFPIGLIIVLLFTTVSASGESQQPQRTVQLTLLPNYMNNQVLIVGSVASLTPTNVEEVQLDDWGLEGDLNVWASDPGKDTTNFYIQGIPVNASLEPTEDAGMYKVTFGPLQVPPGNTLAVTIPFVNLVLDEISPEPHNLDEIKNPKIPLTSLRYSAGEEPLELTLEIPFVPVSKKIDLNLFPLVGELIQKRQDSYRLFGHVTFEDIKDFTLFEKYCQSTVENPFWPYRMADTLFALDYLPIFNFSYLPPTYQYKPSYLLVRSELQSCLYEDGTGQVLTTITGRAFHQPEDTSRFPEFLQDQDAPEQQFEIRERGTGTGVYEIQLGYIFLGPSDRLKVTLPGTNMRSISPAPTRFSYGDTGQILAEFDGPGNFILNVRYAPRPELFIQQLPATIRAFGSRAENLLSSLNTGPSSWVPWTILVVCLITLAGLQRFNYLLRRWHLVIVWSVAGALCYYSFQNVFGLILFAIGVRLLVNWKSGLPDTLIRNILTLIIAIIFLVLDMKVKDFIFLLNGYNLELTLFTPSIMILFSLVIYFIYRHPKEEFKWTPREIVSPAIFLFSLSALDGLQKSLPALLISGGLILIIVQRYDKISQQQSENFILDIPNRFQAVWHSSFLWIGLLSLSIFVISNDVTNSAEVLDPKLGMIRFLLDPILLFISVVLSFLATGSLFLLLYPSLPFREGYLKAILFALGLMTIFIFGIGADDRFVTALPTMLVGRFIYYLSGPLLIGIFMEVYTEKETRKAKNGTKKKTEREDAQGYSIIRNLENLKSFLGPLGSLISLVAPALYAWAFNQPLITSYYDVLEILIQFTLH